MSPGSIFTSLMVARQLVDNANVTSAFVLLRLKGHRYLTTQDGAEEVLLAN